MCYNKPRKNRMPQSSEARDYIDIKLPLKEKPHLEVVKEVTSEVPQKVQKKIAKKVAACISAGIVASSGGFIALGETGNLPEHIQEWYGQTVDQVRGYFGIEEKNQQPVVVIPETKPPETTSLPVVSETTTQTTAQETAPETTAEMIINAPVIEGLKFDNASKTYLAEKNNPYGLKEGEIAGVYTPNVLTIETTDGTSGNFDKGVASLTQEVIKSLQAQALKEKGEYFFPLMVDVRNIDNLGLVELKMLPDQGFKSLGIKMPVGTEFYSPIESSSFQLVFYKEMGYDYNEADLQTFFDIKTENKDGFFDILTTGENLLLENKIIKETKQKTDDGKEIIVRTIELKFGDLMGKIASDEPLRLVRELGAIEDKGEQQLTLLILGENRSEYKGGLDPILKINNTLVSILPKETK